MGSHGIGPKWGRMARSNAFRSKTHGVTWGSHGRKLRHDFTKNGSKKLRQTPEEFVLPLCGGRSPIVLLKEATPEELRGPLEVLPEGYNEVKLSEQQQGTTTLLRRQNFRTHQPEGLAVSRFCSETCVQITSVIFDCHPEVVRRWCRRQRNFRHRITNCVPGYDGPDDLIQVSPKLASSNVTTSMAPQVSDGSQYPDFRIVAIHQ